MDATTLRLLLIGIGAVLLVGLYLWERHRLRAPSDDGRAAARRRAARKHARHKATSQKHDQRTGPTARREPNLGRFGSGTRGTAGRQPRGQVMRDLAPSAVADLVDDDDLPPRSQPRPEPAQHPDPGPDRTPGPEDEAALPRSEAAEAAAAAASPASADSGQSVDAPLVEAVAADDASASWTEATVPAAAIDADAPTPPETAPLIIQFYVLPNDGSFSGEAILAAAAHSHLEPGDMDIFHRVQTDGADGSSAFSMANAFTPGTFPFHAMETFSTKGLVLFAQLAGAPGDLLIFDELARAATAIAEELDGRLLDHGRNALEPEDIRRLRRQVLERVEGTSGIDGGIDMARP